MEAKLTVAIKHVQCSITFFNDYDATAGKSKCDVLGVDLQPACKPAHRPILCHTTRFLPGQHQSELCGRRLWSMPIRRITRFNGIAFLKQLQEASFQIGIGRREVAYAL